MSSNDINWKNEGVAAGTVAFEAARDLCRLVWEHEGSKPETAEGEVRHLISACALLYVILSYQAGTLDTQRKQEFDDGIISKLISSLASLSENPMSVLPFVSVSIQDDIEVLRPCMDQDSLTENGSPEGSLYWEFGKLLHGPDVFMVSDTASVAMHTSTSLLVALKSLYHSMSDK